MSDLTADDLPCLVKKAVDGDAVAWNELVRRFAGFVYYLIRQYRLTETDAQDVSQLVWLRLIEHLAAIREPASLRGWIATTTRHECERYLRRSGRSIAVDPITIDLNGSSPAQDKILALQERDWARSMLARLPSAQRTVMSFYLDGFSLAEIARLLRASEATVRSNFRHARGRLRRIHDAELVRDASDQIRPKPRHSITRSPRLSRLAS